MYAFLSARLPAPVVNAIFIGLRAAALVMIVLLSDKTLGEFDYFQLGR